MADIIEANVDKNERNVVTWETLTSANSAGRSFQPERLRGALATVQFTGTFDSATAVLQGSNDGINWETIKDAQSSLGISMTAAGYAEVQTGFLYIRPSTSGGGGSQDIDCILCARG